MGLNERRKVKELQEVTFPGRVKEITEICGAPIPYEVEWESLADDAGALNFIDNVSCHRLNMALRMICQDDMGKLVKLKNVKDQPSTLSFQGGTLEMHCDYAVGAGSIISDNEIRRVLENGL